MHELENEDQPRKRVKLSEPDANGASQITSKSKKGVAESDDWVAEQLEKETKSGIRAYISPQTPGFSGVLKQRYFGCRRDLCVSN